MKTTIRVYSEGTEREREVTTIKEAMKIARFIVRTTEKRDCPWCVDVITTIGNKTYQYIQVLDGDTLYVASLKSIRKEL